MKLTRENIYINLQGKSKEELTEINNILDYFKQVKIRGNIIEYFDEHCDCFNYLHFYNDEWGADTDFFYLKEKQEVTIQQLKEILQPMDLTIEQQLEKAKAEVKRLEDEIEDSKIKVGDWVKHNNGQVFKVRENVYNLKVINESAEFKKITDQELINKLNELIK